MSSPTSTSTPGTAPFPPPPPPPPPPTAPLLMNGSVSTACTGPVRGIASKSAKSWRVELSPNKAVEELPWFVRYPYHHRAQTGEIEQLRELLESTSAQSYDWNTLDEDGWSMLHYASWYGRTEVIQYLLKNGHGRVNINITNPAGATPLHFAAGAGRLEATKLLLAYGADRDRMNEEKQTPMKLLLELKPDGWKEIQQELQRPASSLIPLSDSPFIAVISPSAPPGREAPMKELVVTSTSQSLQTRSVGPNTSKSTLLFSLPSILVHQLGEQYLNPTDLFSFGRTCKLVFDDVKQCQIHRKIHFRQAVHSFTHPSVWLMGRTTRIWIKSHELAQLDRLCTDSPPTTVVDGCEPTLPSVLLTSPVHSIRHLTIDCDDRMAGPGPFRLPKNLTHLNFTSDERHSKLSPIPLNKFILPETITRLFWDYPHNAKLGQLQLLPVHPWPTHLTSLVNLPDCSSIDGSELHLPEGLIHLSFHNQAKFHTIKFPDSIQHLGLIFHTNVNEHTFNQIIFPSSLRTLRLILKPSSFRELPSLSDLPKTCEKLSVHLSDRIKYDHVQIPASIKKLSLLIDFETRIHRQLGGGEDPTQLQPSSIVSFSDTSSLTSLSISRIILSQIDWTKIDIPNLTRLKIQPSVRTNQPLQSHELPPNLLELDLTDQRFWVCDPTASEANQISWLTVDWTGVLPQRLQAIHLYSYTPSLCLALPASLTSLSFKESFAGNPPRRLTHTTLPHLKSIQLGKTHRAILVAWRTRFLESELIGETMYFEGSQRGYERVTYSHGGLTHIIRLSNDQHRNEKGPHRQPLYDSSPSKVGMHNTPSVTRLVPATSPPAEPLVGIELNPGPSRLVPSAESVAPLHQPFDCSTSSTSTSSKSLTKKEREAERLAVMTEGERSKYLANKEKQRQQARLQHQQGSNISTSIKSSPSISDHSTNLSASSLPPSTSSTSLAANITSASAMSSPLTKRERQRQREASMSPDELAELNRMKEKQRLQAKERINFNTNPIAPVTLPTDSVSTSAISHQRQYVPPHLRSSPSASSSTSLVAIGQTLTSVPTSVSLALELPTSTTAAAASTTTTPLPLTKRMEERRHTQALSTSTVTKNEPKKKKLTLNQANSHLDLIQAISTATNPKSYRPLKRKLLEQINSCPTQFDPTQQLPSAPITERFQFTSAIEQLQRSIVVTDAHKKEILDALWNDPIHIFPLLIFDQPLKDGYAVLVHLLINMKQSKNQIVLLQHLFNRMFDDDLFDLGRVYNNPTHPERTQTIFHQILEKVCHRECVFEYFSPSLMFKVFRFLIKLNSTNESLQTILNRVGCTERGVYPSQHQLIRGPILTHIGNWLRVSNRLTSIDNDELNQHYRSLSDLQSNRALQFSILHLFIKHGSDISAIFPIIGSWIYWSAAEYMIEFFLGLSDEHFKQIDLNHQLLISDYQSPPREDDYGETPDRYFIHDSYPNEPVSLLEFADLIAREWPHNSAARVVRELVRKLFEWQTFKIESPCSSLSSSGSSTYDFRSWIQTIKDDLPTTLFSYHCIQSDLSPWRLARALQSKPPSFEFNLKETCRRSPDRHRCMNELGLTRPRTLLSHILQLSHNYLHELAPNLLANDWFWNGLDQWKLDDPSDLAQEFQFLIFGPTNSNNTMAWDRERPEQDPYSAKPLLANLHDIVWRLYQFFLSIQPPIPQLNVTWLKNLFDHDYHNHMSGVKYGHPLLMLIDRISSFSFVRHHGWNTAFHNSPMGDSKGGLTCEWRMELMKLLHRSLHPQEFNRFMEILIKEMMSVHRNEFTSEYQIRSLMDWLITSHRWSDHDGHWWSKKCLDQIIRHYLNDLTIQSSPMNPPSQLDYSNLQSRWSCSIEAIFRSHYRFDRIRIITLTLSSNQLKDQLSFDLLRMNIHPFLSDDQESGWKEIYPTWIQHTFVEPFKMMLLSETTLPQDIIDYEIIPLLEFIQPTIDFDRYQYRYEKPWIADISTI